MNKRELLKVYGDNVRDNQIGGITDGMTPEVAADLGYSVAPDEVLRMAGTAGRLVMPTVIKPLDLVQTSHFAADEPRITLDFLKSREDVLGARRAR